MTDHHSRNRDRSNDRYHNDSKRIRTRSPVHESHHDINRDNKRSRERIRSRSRERIRSRSRDRDRYQGSNTYDKTRRDSNNDRDTNKYNEKAIDSKVKDNLMKTIESNLKVDAAVKAKAENYDENKDRLKKSRIDDQLISKSTKSKENTDLKKQEQTVTASATTKISNNLSIEESTNIDTVSFAIADVGNDIQYDEKELQEIESFLGNSEEDLFIEEEEKELQLIEERRKKRLEIASKYKNDAETQPKQIISNKIGNIYPEDGNLYQDGYLQKNEVDTNLSNNSSSKSAVPNTSSILAKLNIADDNVVEPVSHQQQTIVDDDVEGRQLAVEKSALEAEEKLLYGTGKYTFDMFSASPSGVNNINLVTGRRALREALLEGEGEHNPHLQSNWDDGEGYYKARIGELIGDRFQTLGVVGKGVFSTVLKCIDLRLGDGTQHVAIKMIRNNDTMRRAAEKEKSILLSIAEHDPNNKKFCVRLLTHLEFRNHVALVFEYQQMNLREALKKFGKDVGINIGAIRMYGRQLFVALKHLMDLQVVHADIKLDNILCSADLKQVKLCDFGSAFRETDTDNDPTPYLVSRFYRAPEIILGLAYDRAIDLWSVCVCLYELFTGHVMLPGRTNNEMLRLMMAVKGRFPNKQIKTHLRAYEALALEPHFDQDLRFRQYEIDPITGKAVLRLIDINNPTRDLATVLRSSKAGADDMKLVSSLTDLLEKGLVLEPSKRLSVIDTFKHPFFASSSTK